MTNRNGCNKDPDSVKGIGVTTVAIDKPTHAIIKREALAKGLPIGLYLRELAASQGSNA